MQSSSTGTGHAMEGIPPTREVECAQLAAQMRDARARRPPRRETARHLAPAGEYRVSHALGLFGVGLLLLHVPAWILIR